MLCILLHTLINNFRCKCMSFYSYSAFYDYKFLKMGIQGDECSFYLCGSFLWLLIFKNGYTGE